MSVWVSERTFNYNAYTNTNSSNTNSSLLNMDAGMINGETEIEILIF